MRLILQNGYPCPWPKDAVGRDPDEYVEQAADVTLTLVGVTHVQWLHALTIEFEGPDAAHKAAQLTGWKPWSIWGECDNTLEAEMSPEEGYAHPAIVTTQAYDGSPKTAYCGFILVND